MGMIRAATLYDAAAALAALVLAMPSDPAVRSLAAESPPIDARSRSIARRPEQQQKKRLRGRSSSSLSRCTWCPFSDCVPLHHIVSGPAVRQAPVDSNAFRSAAPGTVHPAPFELESSDRPILHLRPFSREVSTMLRRVPGVAARTWSITAGIWTFPAAGADRDGDTEYSAATVSVRTAKLRNPRRIRLITVPPRPSPSRRCLPQIRHAFRVDPDGVVVDTSLAAAGYRPPPLDLSDMIDSPPRAATVPTTNATAVGGHGLR
ncbi:hypothetical protein GUJ93_ZPchr0006g42297 [Zizania palustris]|uniref:Uncharacterized protein n=1 Tax=Zizania palustris TaxID=103762 RepID=A0A8J5T749_ZIZPA|nr:hypothetical protein GUJ93_ZPchr0006g42297 [Zizania palustris]